jgi:hypothetical protein
MLESDGDVGDIDGICERLGDVLGARVIFGSGVRTSPIGFLEDDTETLFSSPGNYFMLDGMKGIHPPPSTFGNHPTLHSSGNGASRFLPPNEYSNPIPPPSSTGYGYARPTPPNSFGQPMMPLSTEQISIPSSPLSMIHPTPEYMRSSNTSFDDSSNQSI